LPLNSQHLDKGSLEPYQWHLLNDSNILFTLQAPKLADHNGVNMKEIHTKNSSDSNLSSRTWGQGAEAILLAGGLGTRLRDAVPDLPKCMAPVAGRPFLSYVIDYLRMQGVQHLTFSLGYKSEIVEDFLQQQYPTLSYSTVIESEPLGTGGAIHLSMQKTTTNDIIVANADTLFEVDIASLLLIHRSLNAACTLALKPMQQFDRYGVVETDAEGRITSFKEKQWYASGQINGGLYIVNKEQFLQHTFPQQFSFEKDYLEKYCEQDPFYAAIQNGYFIDIGVPEDYSKAQTDLQRPSLDLNKIDKNWTLFLDRDGVINEEKVGNYVLRWDQFIFSSGTLETFKRLHEKFGKIIVVSNQRGVGKKLMSEAELQSIHYEMQREVAIVGGNIDKIYYCTEVDDKCFNRKPNPGMALKAKKDFADIDFSKSIMVGNKPGDMRFGRSAGMFTVFVTTTNPDQPFPHPDIDLMFDSLAQFADAV
jgi:D-glycero-alpha-D-manno-heptose 1-phosphate guanylyltransferase